MVWGLAISAAIRTAAAAAAKTAPKVLKSPYGKVGILGGSIGWAGLGIIAGLGLAALLVLFLLFRRR